MSRIPLSVLDLSPFGAGQSPADGLRATLDLARAAEGFGYRRFWLAEHHFNSGIAGSAPHVLLAAVAAATERIRVGTAATIIGNYSPAQVAEAIGVVAALHPDRVDLGIGRSSARPPAPAQVPGDREVDGLLLPAATTVFPFDAPRFVAQARALGRADDAGDRFADDVAEILGYIDGPSAGAEGVTLHATPAEGQVVETWIHGSTPGPSARLAGELGLPFGANYHVAPSFVLDAIAAYREAFRPGRLAAPHVIVSVDVLVAETDAEAERLGAGYGRWVHDIRAGDGAAPYPTPEEAAANPLTPAEAEIVRDRLRTRFVGAPDTVVARLETLQRVTGADELLVTTIAHDPADRIASYRLLAEAWGGDATASRPVGGATRGDDVTIRLVRPEEYERAGDVTAAAYLASYDALSDQYLASLRDVAGRVREGDVWVAADPAGDLLGTVWVSRPNRPLNPDIGRPGETDFRQLAVAPHARGRGIGAALTRHVIALAAERGSHRVVMNSGPEMTGAHALYAKLGFRRLHEREREFELEPGRIVTLLAFGYDLRPEPDAETAGRAASWRFEHVAWDDADAHLLREQMDAELAPRYADLFADVDPETAERTFRVDPDTIALTVVAVDDGGTPVAHAALRELAHDGTTDLEIKRFYVQPRARGLGLSQALLAELERVALDRGASRLILQTGERQPDAIVLYEKSGYAPVPVYEPYTPFAISRCFAKDLR